MRKVDAVIFLRDPFTAHPHEPDVSALLRVCDVHNIPLATNMATAEEVLHLILQTCRLPSELEVSEQRSEDTILAQH